MGDKADILKKGSYNSGEVIGHVNEKDQIRKKDGFFTRGKTMGYVDKDNSIRKPNGLIFKGKAVGQIKGYEAYDNNKLFSSGELWGYIDKDGNIRIKDSGFRNGEIIGQVRGNNKEKALGFFILRFNEIKEEVEALVKEIEAANVKTSYSKDVNNIEIRISKAKALGDFDMLLRMLKEAKTSIDKEFEDNLYNKKAIISEAKKLYQSTNWKETDEKFKELSENWKSIGNVPFNKSKEIWEEFNYYKQRFYTRRKEYYENLNKEQEENLNKKRMLISRIDTLADYPGDWKIAGEKVKEIRDNWNSIGDVPWDNRKDIYTKYKENLNRFYRIRNEHYERKKEEFKANRRQFLKERISKSESYKDSLERSISYHEDKISDIRSKMSNIWSGSKAYEIRSKYERSIDEREDKIREIRSKISEVNSNLYKMRRELEDLY